MLWLCCCAEQIEIESACSDYTLEARFIGEDQWLGVAAVQCCMELLTYISVRGLRQPCVRNPTDTCVFSILTGFCFRAMTFWQFNAPFEPIWL